MYQRRSQNCAELLNQKHEKDEIMAHSNVYSESGIDYLKRVIQVIDLEFKIRPDMKGSNTYLYGYGTGSIGIGKDSKDYSRVAIM